MQRQTITMQELAEIYGERVNTIHQRLRLAGTPYIRRGRFNHYPREQALAAAAPKGIQLPPDTISLTELAELAEMKKNSIKYRLDKAGIKPVGTLSRRGSGSGNAGGHPMLLYNRRDAMLAVLED
ncbi:MAG: hypothetical protein IKZ07_07250 [Akkermansia sp.]|nr:hypothetical protein [Akkermansia sp.]